MSKVVRVAVVRHGKAQADSHSGRDEDRELKPRGERQAAHLGSWMAGGGAGSNVVAVVSSPAVRARETARRIAEACGLEVDLDERLFIGAEPSKVYEVWAERATGEGIVVVVGHNPTMSRVVVMATGGPGAGGYSEHVRTGEANVFEFNGTIEPGAGAHVARERLAE